MTTPPHPTVHGFLRIIEGKPRGYAEQRQSPEDLALMTVDEHFQRMGAHIAPAEQVASPPDQESHIPAQTIAEAAVEQLIKSGAEHYQEFQFDIHIAGRAGARPVVVTVAFSDGPSAHELRLKAEQERDTALATLAELGKQEPVAFVVDVQGYKRLICATREEAASNAEHFEKRGRKSPITPLYAAPGAQAGQVPGRLYRALAMVTAALEADGDRVTSVTALRELQAALAAAPAQGGE